MILSDLKVFFINILLALATLVPQDTLSIGMISQPNSFLPSQAKSDSERLVSQMVFRSLFKYQDGELISDLVESWSVSDDITTYNIKIKETANWQDGNPISSDDILYTLTLYEKLINEMDIEKISPKEIKISITTPTSMLPSILTFGIEPAHLRSQSKLKPIGSTSYKILLVKKDRKDVTKITMESFNKSKQYKRINVHFYKTENDQQTGYKLGEINALLSNSDISLAGTEKLSITYAGRYFALVFNTRQPTLEQVENRKILESVLDLDTFLSGHYYENSTPAKGPISKSFASKDSLFESKFNPNAQLTTAQSSVITKLLILLPNNTDGRQIETLLRNSWEKKLGIELQFEFLDLSEIINRGKKDEFDVLFIGHETTPDPDRYTFWHSTQIGKLNLSGFSDLRADKALEEGRKTFSTDDRIKHYSIFQDVMSTKVPAIYLYHPGNYFYVSTKTPIPLPKILYYPSDILKNL